jgi:hypothetical protein
MSNHDEMTSNTDVDAVPEGVLDLGNTFRWVGVILSDRSIQLYPLDSRLVGSGFSGKEKISASAINLCQRPASSWSRHLMT